MARLTRDHHLDAALRLILGSFQYSQEQGRLTDAEIAGTFLGLLGQLECSSQLTPVQHALCREIYVLVARRETAIHPPPPLPEYPALPKAVPDPAPDRPVRALRVRFWS